MEAVTQPAPGTTATRVAEASQIGEARRSALAASRDAAFDETDAGRAGIVATEAASNVVLHAGGGEILVQPQAPPARALEIVALDRGPGIPDLARALADGHSSSGTRGTGLGAMRRLSTRFECYTRPGQGTAIRMEIGGGEEGPAGAPSWGGVSVSRRGEAANGDAWHAVPRENGFRIVVADGLGHGPLAREAALVALAAARGDSPAHALEHAHEAARATRGVALGVADVDLAARRVRWAAIGNVAAVLANGGAPRNLVAMNGIVGQGRVRVREFTYPFTPGTALVIASDGLSTRWSPDPYPGLLARHPTLAAAVLYRDHARGNDDTTVVVARLEAP
jgi:anti-sigma regulatory factor (Ser/Thr protein kinase)